MKGKSITTGLLVFSIVVAGLGGILVQDVSPTGHEDHEDWTDGPGRIEDRANIGPTTYGLEINGIPISMYVRMWNLDADNGGREWPVSDQEARDDDLSPHELLNIGQNSDFSVRQPPGSVREWNGQARHSFENRHGGTPRTSWVPGSTSLSNGDYIKDAYMKTFAVDPSVFIDDGQNRQLRYADSSGRVLTLIEYRYNGPNDESGRCYEKSYSRDYVRINYHQLATEPNCNSDDCRLGRDEANEAIRTLNYNNLDEGRQTLYVEGEIEGKWSYVEREATYDSCGKNETECGDCEDWNRDTGSVTDTVQVDNQFTIQVREQLGAQVRYARMPNGNMQIYIHSSNIWTEAELPNGATVSSGWRMYISRDEDYTTLFSYTQEGHGLSERTPRNPPVRITAFPSVYGTEGISNQDGDGAAPKIIMSDGEMRQSPTPPPRLQLSYASTEDASGSSDPQYQDTRTVVAQIPQVSNGPTTVKGVLSSTEVTRNPDVRTVIKPEISYEFTEYDKDTNNGTIRVEVTEPDGDPISTQGRPAEVVIDGNAVETNSNGVATYEGNFPATPNEYTIEFSAQNWWTTPSDQQAYTSVTRNFNPPGGIDLWDTAQWLLMMLIIFGGLYFVIRRALLNLTNGEIDLRKPWRRFWDIVSDLLRW